MSCLILSTYLLHYICIDKVVHKLKKRNKKSAELIKINIIALNKEQDLVKFPASSPDGKSNCLMIYLIF